MEVCKNLNFYIKGGYMDTFDSIFEENVVKRNSVDSNNLDLLKEKREEIYKFFSSVGTLAIVIFLWLSLIFNTYTSIRSLGQEGTMISSQIISLMITLVFGLIIGIGYWKVYSGSKNKDHTLVDNGFQLLGTYFKGLKILLVVTSVLSGLLLLMMLIVSFSMIFVAISVGLIYLLAFYVTKIFGEFINELKMSFSSGYALVPSVKKIITYLIIVFAVTVVFTLVVTIVYQTIDIRALLGDQSLIDVTYLISFLKVFMIYFYIAMGVVLLFQLYFIYYVAKFEKTFTVFNQYYSKKVEEAQKNIGNSIEL